MSFENKVVIVTGSSSGIGASAAIAFAKEGANVVIVGRNVKKLKNVYKQCVNFGKETLLVKADVSQDSAVKDIMDKTIEKFGKLDILVNNAGIIAYADITSEDFMTTYDHINNVNLRAAVYLTHQATPHLIKTRGNIVNISSIGASFTGHATFLVSYCVSKAALNHFSRCVALKLAEYGVRVNIVSPGPVITDILENSGRTTKLQWESLAETTALKRVSQPNEIADLILFLASEKARGITGSDFVSDNGVLIKK